MGIILRTKDTNFEDIAVSFIPPVADGLEYWAYFGSAERAVRNLAPGKPGAAVVGSPTYGTGFASLGQSGYVQTNVPDLAQSTLIAVFRPENDRDSVLIASGPSVARVPPYTGTTFGGSLYVDDAIAADGNVTIRTNRSHFDGTSGTTTATLASIIVPTTSSWKAVAGTYDGALKQVQIRDLSGGDPVTTLPSAPNDLVDLSAVNYRVGWGHSTGLGTATTDIAFAAIYSRPLTTQELADVYGHAQGYLLDRFGIVV